MADRLPVVVALGSVDSALVAGVLDGHCRFVPDPGDAELSLAAGAIVRADARADQALLDKAPALRVVARTGVGVEPVASFADRIITRRLRALNPALPGLYQRRTAEYDHAVAELAAGTDAPQPDGPFLYGLRLPAGSQVVGRFERCAGALEAAGRAAREHAERVLRGAAASGRPDASHQPRRAPR